MTVLEHAQALIKCKSITPEEGGALRYLERVLGEVGFTCHRLPFQTPGTISVDNLYARIGSGSPHVCFAGHTDVVPPGDTSAWHHGPFAGEVANGILYGRGACDMKGGVAASVAAALSFLKEKNGLPGGSISFLITGDEEGPAVNGTKPVVDWLIERGERPDCCILPEPTSETNIGDTIKIGRRGSLSATLTVHGVQGHAAYPHKAKNPLPRLIDALNLLKLKPLDEGTAHFQPSNLEITGIDTGNPTHNVIPAATTAHFNIRFNDHHSGDSLKAWVKTQVEAALYDTGLTYALQYQPVTESFMTSPAGFVQDLVSCVETQTGRQPAQSTGGGTSDARFIKDLCPVVELGLLSATAHQVDEHVPVADLQTLTEIFTLFLRKTLR